MTLACHTKLAPAWVSLPLLAPSAGPGISSWAAANRFSATQRASVRALSALALAALCATLRNPAASAIATIAAATRTSISVKPRRRAA